HIIYPNYFLEKIFFEVFLKWLIISTCSNFTEYLKASSMHISALNYILNVPLLLLLMVINLAIFSS
ncbi:hypothetical protein JRA69_002889, partial [Providencia stuartii]